MDLISKGTKVRFNGYQRKPQYGTPQLTVGQVYEVTKHRSEKYLG